jgi:GAF domain-containing protein
LLAGARFVHIRDLAERDDPMSRAAVEQTGTRTLLFVPLRNADTLVGMIVAGRTEVRPYSVKKSRFSKTSRRRRSSRWRTRGS